MANNNTQLVKILFGIIVVLSAIIYWETHPSKNKAAYHALSLVGIVNQNVPLGEETSQMARAPMAQEQGIRTAPTRNIQAETFKAAAINNLRNNNEASSAQINNVNPAALPQANPIVNPPPVAVANPIPTDAQVTERVNAQNARYNEAYTVLAAHQALVSQVRQAAEATKYQTVKSQDIPAPSTDQAPDDAIAKIKNNQAFASH